MSKDTIEYLEELTEADCLANPEMALDRITYAVEEIKRMISEGVHKDLLLSELYQVCGSLLADAGAFDSDEGQILLGELMEPTGRSLLPWPAFREIADLPNEPTSDCKSNSNKIKCSYCKSHAEYIDQGFSICFECRKSNRDLHWELFGPRHPWDVS